jgi:hypothetical protein
LPTHPPPLHQLPSNIKHYYSDKKKETNTPPFKKKQRTPSKTIKFTKIAFEDLHNVMKLLESKINNINGRLSNTTKNYKNNKPWKNKRKT